MARKEWYKNAFYTQWRKTIITERFIRTFKNKIYKYMTLVSKNVYIDKLDDIVKKYNSTYYSTIKMKPIDVKWNTYIDSNKEINDQHPKFKLLILHIWIIKL